jgi:hypothetical protein
MVLQTTTPATYFLNFMKLHDRYYCTLHLISQLTTTSSYAPHIVALPRAGAVVPAAAQAHLRGTVLPAARLVAIGAVSRHVARPAALEAQACSRDTGPHRAVLGVGDLQLDSCVLCPEGKD